MKYTIVHRYKWESASKIALPFNEYADCIGELKIIFSCDGQEKIYQNRSVNIPLFLTELDDFLNRVNSAAPQHWNLGFAPFAHGLLREGSLLISARAGDAFSDGVYDATPLDDLARLKAQVAKDIFKFGRVLMDADQAKSS